MTYLNHMLRRAGVKARNLSAVCSSNIAEICIGVALFIPFGFDIYATDEFYEKYFWFFSQFIFLLVVCAGAIGVPYKRLALKGSFFCFAIWRSVVLIVNWTPVDHEVGWWVGTFITFSYVSFIVRMFLLKEIPDKFPVMTYEVRYYLIPVHSIQGLLQAVFLPWHMGRYETRSISDGESLWLLHRSEFKRVPLNLVSNEGQVCVPLGKRMSFEQRAELSKLVGKRKIPLIRDCRLLTVCGPIKDYVK